MSAKRTGHAKLLREFFARNPDEELTFADAATKFGITEHEVKLAAQYLTQIREIRVDVVRVIRSSIRADEE